MTVNASDSAFIRQFDSRGKGDPVGLVYGAVQAAGDASGGTVELQLNLPLNVLIVPKMASLYIFGAAIGSAAFSYGSGMSSPTGVEVILAHTVPSGDLGITSGNRRGVTWHLDPSIPCVGDRSDQPILIGSYGTNTNLATYWLSFWGMVYDPAAISQVFPDNLVGILS